MKIKFPIAFLSLVFCFLSIYSSYGCSMYKVTVDGKTMVGCNEDAWRNQSKLWFVNAKQENEYGVAF